MDILDIFYRNIVPEAVDGRIDCFFYYNISFSTIVVENNRKEISKVKNNNVLNPTLFIKNKALFDSLLVEYVNLALDFYNQDILDTEIEDINKRKFYKVKSIITLLFANATIEDFNNPCEFLNKRINFIKNDISNSYELGYFEIFKGNVFIDIKKDIINNETPYQILIKVLSDNGDEFVFPSVKLGISDDIVYIYAIQNKINPTNSFSKKINRVLYKVGEGYEHDYEEDMEDLKDITASFLVALNMCVSYLQQNGYDKIVVPSFLNSRWNAKVIANERKISSKNLSEDEVNSINEEHEHLQNNLTNKLIRTFLRLGCHFNNIDVLSFPFEYDSCLHIFVNSLDVKCNNTLLYETYKLVENNINKKKHIK